MFTEPGQLLWENVGHKGNMDEPDAQQLNWSLRSDYCAHKSHLDHQECSLMENSQVYKNPAYSTRTIHDIKRHQEIIDEVLHHSSRHAVAYDVLVCSQFEFELIDRYSARCST